MKRSLLIALSSILLLGASGLRAEEAKPDEKGGRPASAEKRRQNQEKLTPEEREKRRKEAVEKRDARLKELRAKKEAGTLNDVEKKQLERLEQQAERAKRAKERTAGSDGANPAKRPKKDRSKDAGE